ncbi:hypothetical protein [Pseudomonas sp. RA_5y_Pfl1_P24]|uniref:hypothetical protein n=1 Tax=Pseudomonas sp. RA_5y_Pfl1_P24 TaxID=3088706 RepID=UPI0030DBA186
MRAFWVALIFLKLIASFISGSFIMGRIFATSNELGYFDFYTNLIEIRNYTAPAKSVLEEALRETLPNKWDEYWPVRVNFRSLVVHEATHFNDCVTTSWGLEFLFRKLNLMKRISEGLSVEQALSVFYLNVSELRSHKELLELGEFQLSRTTSMTHEVVVDDRFGPLIFVIYNCGDEVIQKVPLSMLAVLEANALANETLVKIVAAEALEACSEKDEYLDEVNRDFQKILDDKERSEYTVLISLVKLHFRELTLREQLVFTATLCRFTLDVNMIACSAISSYIERFFLNEYAGATLSQDMRREGSRAVIFFKTALFIYGWMQTSNYSTRVHVLKLLKTNPLAVILKFWASRVNGFLMHYGMTDSFMFSSSLKNITELSSAIDEEIIRSCSLYNRSVLSERPLGVCDLSEVRLLDVFLSDETEICVPNRVDFSISDYLIGNVDIFNKTEEYCRLAVSKFFMRPEDFILHVSSLEDFGEEPELH